MLASAGIAQYEISNFARTAMQSRHNSKYWTREPYLGFGVDAHSMLELVWGRAPSPVQAERSSAPARAHGNSRFAIGGVEEDRHQAVRFATPDSLDAYMNRAPHTVTPVSAQAAIEESFFLGLRLNRGVDLERLRTQSRFWEGHDFSRAINAAGMTALAAEATRRASRQEFTPAAIWESAIQQCVQDGLLEQQGTTLRLTARGRLLSNEVFARFLTEETKVGTGHVNPR
jgi:oxygen-independent coproporphyrinogen-3 oxidase